MPVGYKSSFLYKMACIVSLQLLQEYFVQDGQCYVTPTTARIFCTRWPVLCHSNYCKNILYKMASVVSLQLLQEYFVQDGQCYVTPTTARIFCTRWPVLCHSNYCKNILYMMASIMLCQLLQCDMENILYKMAGMYRNAHIPPPPPPPPPHAHRCTHTCRHTCTCHFSQNDSYFGFILSGITH